MSNAQTLGCLALQLVWPHHSHLFVLWDKAWVMSWPPCRWVRTDRASGTMLTDTHSWQVFWPPEMSL